MHLVLTAHQPYRLTSVLGSHGWIRLAPNRTDPELSTLTRVERLESGRIAEIRVAEAPGGVCAAVVGDLTAAERQEVASKVAWMLDLDKDLSSFYALTRQEPKLSQI